MGFFRNTSLFNHSVIYLFLLATIISSVNIKSFPLADQNFQKIYAVQIQKKTYYLTIQCKNINILSLSFTQQKQFAQAPRFNIFGQLLNHPHMVRKSYTLLRNCDAEIFIHNNITIQIKRKNGQVLLLLESIVFQQLNNKFTIKDNSIKWGLGQRFQRNFKLNDGTWTIWNRDKPWEIDDGRIGVSQNTYGHQPIYLAKSRSNGNYHLVYFKNTFGLQVQSTSNSNNLIYHSVGGKMHFLIFIGDKDPQTILQRYHQFIGGSHIPPFWSMGFHQCRWGYRTAQVLNEVVVKYRQHDLPLDVIWSDLQYMQDKKIFTVNQNTHPSQMLNTMIQTQKIHFVPLVDAGISIHDSIAIQLGKSLNVFLKDPTGKFDYLAQVWPGKVHFVDGLHPNATKYWKSQLQRLYSQVKFSGIWLDMNQPSNFQGGQSTKQPFFIQQNQNINKMTISVDIPHYNNKNIDLKHREVHAYFGHLIAVQTHQYLKDRKMRPFIISRSNSVGTGAFAGHWTGDNVATWQFLRLSISGNFLFQIFGMQIVGADICGFYRHTTQELCSRWMQVGSFYTFARNHNHQQARSQQPYSFGPMLLQTSRMSLKTRYSLLKQIYTIIINKKGLGSIYRPIFFQFIQDEGAMQQQFAQTQVLIGKYIMTTPIVQPNVQQRQVYFPGNQSWFKFQINPNDGSVIQKSIIRLNGLSKAKISNPLPSAPPTFLRQGFMILSTKPELRTASLSNNFNIFASLKQGSSRGEILGLGNYEDDNELSNCISVGCYYSLQIKQKGFNQYELSWQYINNNAVSINIVSVTIANGDKILKNNQLITINTKQGKKQMVFTQVK